MTQTLAINLGKAKAGLHTLAADALAPDGTVLATIAAGYTDEGNGSYLWPIDAAAGAVAIRVYDDTGTLLILAVDSACSEIAGAVRVVTLADVKAWLKIDDDAEDVLIQGIIDAATDFIAGGLNTPMPDPIPASLVLAIKLLCGHWFTHREAAQDRRIDELPIGLQAIINQNRIIPVV